MSQENVEIVRRVYRAFNDRDLDAWVALHTEDVEWRLIGGFADMLGTEFIGHEGLRRFFDDWVGNLGVRGEIKTLHDADDRVVVIVDAAGAGEVSGAPATIQGGQVYSFRDGRVSAVDNYYDASEALAAVGLSE